MKNVLKIVLFAVVTVLLTIFIYNSCTIKVEDNVKFSKEYTKINEDNVFVYKDIKDIINVLENGTGVIYLGFPECKWCQSYAVYINDLAKETGVSEILYYDILEIRKNNTEDYQKIVSLLGDNLLDDENLNKRIFVPDVTVVKNGKVIAHNNETSVIEGYDDPKDYWTNEKIENLKSSLKNSFSEVSTICTTCN